MRDWLEKPNLMSAVPGDALPASVCGRRTRADVPRAHSPFQQAEFWEYSVKCNTNNILRRIATFSKHSERQSDPVLPDQKWILLFHQNILNDFPLWVPGGGESEDRAVLVWSVLRHKQQCCPLMLASLVQISTEWRGEITPYMMKIIGSRRCPKKVPESPRNPQTTLLRTSVLKPMKAGAPGRNRDLIRPQIWSYEGATQTNDQKLQPHFSRVPRVRAKEIQFLAFLSTVMKTTPGPSRQRSQCCLGEEASHSSPPSNLHR